MISVIWGFECWVKPAYVNVLRYHEITGEAYSKDIVEGGVIECEHGQLFQLPPDLDWVVEKVGGGLKVYWGEFRSFYHQGDLDFYSFQYEDNKAIYGLRLHDIDTEKECWSVQLSKLSPGAFCLAPDFLFDKILQGAVVPNLYVMQS